MKRENAYLFRKLIVAIGMLAALAAQSGEASADIRVLVKSALAGEREALAGVLKRRGEVDTAAVSGRAMPKSGMEQKLDHLDAMDVETRMLMAALGDRRPLARAMPGDSGPSDGFDLSDVTAEGGPQWRCLTEALYFEARGESLAGQVAVAEVILNRVDSRRYPDSVCAVVGQGSQNLNACQFSFKCDGKREDMGNRKAFDRAGRIARVMLDGRDRSLTLNATHYHADSVNPRWARRLVPTAKIGAHVFYRLPARVAQR